MSTTSDTDTVISVRLSGADKASLEFVLPRTGFKTQSAFCRHAVNQALANAFMKMAQATATAETGGAADDFDASVREAA